MNGNILGIGARLSKLRAMSPGEVLARMQYTALLAVERRQHGRERLAPPDRLRRALRDDLRRSDWQDALVAARQTTAGRFLSGAYEREALRSLFQSRYRAELDDTLKQAARAREHRFEFFGEEFQYGTEIDWQADPVTGHHWPARFHGDVLVHAGDVGSGDVKHVWELSRQQYLIDLAKAFFLTGSRDDVAALQRLVTSWIRGNPYGTGVNWSCALEPAFRAWSWLWAYHLTVDALDPAFHLQWLESFYDHGRFLARHLEHYSSPYNHLIGEAATLYALGSCFPEFGDAPRWRRLGKSVLERRLPEQFYDDGGSVEQSTFYHHATLGFYLLTSLIARANRDTLSRSIWNAIDKALTFSTALLQPDGRIPEIGGADDGKPIRMEHLPFWDFRAYQAIGAVLLGRRDLREAAGRFYEDALWLTGTEGLKTFDGLEPEQPSFTDVLLPASGYAVSRSDWSTSADYVCFDVGEQAAGMRADAVPNSMHGHADCLSVVVWLGGRRVLVDSGLYAYNCGGEWEAHFRETAAHNTARIDGRDQARHIGKMAWSDSYRATIEGDGAASGQSWTIGSHDGYARGPEGVTHRRVVWRRPDGYVLILDEFAGSGAHDLEVNFQFAPGELQLAGDSGAVFNGFAELTWMGSAAWTRTTACGGPSPADGWICSSLGVRRPAPRLTLRTRMTTPRVTLLTVIADRDRVHCSVPALGTVAAAASLVALATERQVDWVTASGLPAAAAFHTNALLAVCRMDGPEMTERHIVQGTHADVDRAALAGLTDIVRRSRVA